MQPTTERNLVFSDETDLVNDTRYLLPLSSFQLLYGRLSTLFGRRPLFIFAYSTFLLGCLGCGIARSMPELIAARVVAGVGGGGFNTLASKIKFSRLL